MTSLRNVAKACYRVRVWVSGRLVFVNASEIPVTASPIRMIILSLLLSAVVLRDFVHRCVVVVDETRAPRLLRSLGRTCHPFYSFHC